MSALELASDTSSNVAWSRKLELFTNGMTGQSQENVLERRDLGAEVGDSHPMLRQALNDLGDELLSAALD